MDDAREETQAEAGGSGNLTRRRLAGLAAAAAAGGAISRVPGMGGTDERAFAAQRGRKHPPRPNVLFIMADDLGWGDLSSYGHPQIKTPNIDGLARSGVRFTNAYSTSAVCSPTRFGLYTGRYPGRLSGGLKEPLNAPEEGQGIPADHPTLASILKKRGYETAMFGKWHCGYLPWFSPTRCGWDQFLGSYGGGNDYFSKVDTRGAHDLYKGETEYEDPRYYTDILGEKAARFVSRRHTSPWLLNLNFSAPHWPWEGPKDRAVSKELTERIRAGANPTITLLHQDGGSLAVYRSMVERLDRAVGRVLRALRKSGARDDTLVIFSSDNGGEPRYSYNWPFSGGKHDLSEGGIRVPLIASWPGRLRPRQVSKVPVVTHDLTATLVELAGGKPDPAYPFDGISLVDYLFRGSEPARRDLFWRMKDERALRRGRYKYLRTANGTDHLYDLKADKHEGADLRTKLPDQLAALRSAWEQIDSTLLPYPT